VELHFGKGLFEMWVKNDDVFGLFVCIYFWNEL